MGVAGEVRWSERSFHLLAAHIHTYYAVGDVRVYADRCMRVCGCVVIYVHVHQSVTVPNRPTTFGTPKLRFCLSMFHVLNKKLATLQT